jgi:redox-sensitive bicupin YhaK (pirin superfamily)
MERKKFIQKTLLASGLMAAGLKGAQLFENDIDELKPLDASALKALVGFNHLPSVEKEKNMNQVIHRSDSRGHANHGWLDSHHTFSFANYYNPERMHFGVLRVLNDDRVSQGMGFGTHPHDNMEIISIPLEGDLEHKDSMGNTAVIKNGDIQILSAGTGITHSEYNRNKAAEVKFLQIWVFPNKKNVIPRYDQITLNVADRHNKFQQILSPDPNDAGVWIHQDAWFHMANLDQGKSLEYQIKRAQNGAYLFLLEGNITVNGEVLNRRDGLGIWNTQEPLHIEATSNAQLLVMDVPMSV